MKKNLLKTPRVVHDFIYKLWFLQMNSYDGDGRKNPEIYTETKEKSPVWLPSHPVYKIGGRLFSGAKRTENKPDLP